MRWRSLLCGVALLLPTGALCGAEAKAPSRGELRSAHGLLSGAVAEVVKMQEDGGAGPYEGVYRVAKDIPVGYRVGGPALVAGPLLYAAPAHKSARKAVERGLAFVLKELDHPL